MKKSFLNREKPALTCMVQAYTADRIKELVKMGREQGADAFGMQFCKLSAEERNANTYRELFEYAGDAPVYVTNYRGQKNEGKTDEVLADELIELAKCGATLCDVMGDYFDFWGDLHDKCDGELTMNKNSIKKQMELIDRLHAAGAEVLMSSHVCAYTPAERVMEIAMEHKRRGADISKIVTAANTVEEEIENLRIANMLKEELGIPFLYLAGGENHTILRRLGIKLGACMALCVVEHDECATKAQPLLSHMKKIRDDLEF